MCLIVYRSNRDAGKKVKALIPATALVLFQIFEMCTDYEFFIMYHDIFMGASGYRWKYGIFCSFDRDHIMVVARSGIYLMINGKQPVSCGHYLSGPCHVL